MNNRVIARCSLWLLVCSFFLLIKIADVVAESQEPIEVISKKDDLEEIQLKSRLEDRLARDIRSYLGHNRFIVNVDVSLQRIRQVIKQSLPSMQASSQPNRSYPKIQFPDSPNNEFIDDDVDSLPGLPYVDIPVDRDKDAELQFMREQIKRLQREQKQPTWNGNGKEGDRETEQTVAVFNKIKKLVVSVVVELNITSEQEVFIRNLVYRKASLNDLRGDEFKFIKTEFSSAPVTDKLVGIEEEHKDGSWLNQYFDELVLALLSLLMLLLLTLILLSLRKKAEVNQPHSPEVAHKAAISTADSPKTLEEKGESESESERIQKTRQSIISQGLGHPRQVQLVMQELSQQEDKIQMVASMYKILGRSLFRSLFPNIQQDGLQSIMAYLADQTIDEEQLNTNLFGFHELIKNAIEGNQDESAHPFDFLKKLNDSQVLYLIQHEEPRLQALVISQLSSEQGARVLNRVSDKKQTQVIAELGQFETFPLEAFKDVADRMAKAAQSVPSFENVNADGLNMLINMLDNMTSGEEAKVLKKLKHDKPDTFYRLRKSYFTFADLMRTPRQVLSNALREIDRGFIGPALCNTPDEFKLHVLTSLPPKLKALAREDLKRTEGRIAIKDVDSARRQIVHKLREYIAAGKFSMDQLHQPQRKTSS